MLSDGIELRRKRDLTMTERILSTNLKRRTNDANVVRRRAITHKRNTKLSHFRVNA